MLKKKKQSASQHILPTSTYYGNEKKVLPQKNKVTNVNRLTSTVIPTRKIVQKDKKYNGYISFDMSGLSGGVRKKVVTVNGAIKKNVIHTAKASKPPLTQNTKTSTDKTENIIIKQQSTRILKREISINRQIRKNKSLNGNLKNKGKNTSGFFR